MKAIREKREIDREAFKIAKERLIKEYGIEGTTRSRIRCLKKRILKEIWKK